MARRQIEGTRVLDTTLMSGNRMGVLEVVLGATFQVPDDAPHVLYLDPNGAGRTVKLPVTVQKGDFYWIHNPAAGAFALTVQDSGGNALVPALSVAQNKAALVVYINATAGWKPLAGA